MVASASSAQKWDGPGRGKFPKRGEFPADVMPVWPDKNEVWPEKPEWPDKSEWPEKPEWPKKPEWPNFPMEKPFPEVI